ncbi:Enamine deaminase RidA, house cleaning of reactive enamine intermediates, YjgF/YER057c/UK114 family [Thermomonospora echinospora]|uniref:Enamine deaminase RidA, house cleaning of reactive enamine intermediates, YjgF/YER057c/UK114 family n=1 Tax=Thermomonospora echinospora TaxID=1992 RepID=A0A1H6D798_9ACTN|nr:RidA family protein [Thermomonospora echinospora]SEG81287.1 Enamine deaminase RidA, house cleaning of reactive enamine intermediates, YjgF/YER057c/UK114 family [Thermomonospora echinospora]
MSRERRGTERTRSHPEQRLGELGLTLPEAVPPVATYVPAVRSGDHVHVSGQVPLREGRLIAAGRLGDTVSVELGYECARQCALNALAALKAEIGDLAAVARVVKAVVYVASTADFTRHPQVGDGASDLLCELFGDAGRHARSAVGVLTLPLSAPVELELLVELHRPARG